ncbi:dihydrofolate reductase [Arthrobacter pascens]|nr:dihydrofolate reductase [Arthrobacter pascens]
MLSASSLSTALAAAADTPGIEDVYIFGGARIYEQALNALIPDELLISVINAEFECDTFLSAVPAEYVLEMSEKAIYGTTSVRHETYSKA